MIEPIYISRPVSYMDALRLQEYAEMLGLQNIVTDMHVTLAYSTTPVDWDLPAFQPDPRRIMAAGGNPEGQIIEKFSGGAVVLGMPSPEFSGRWAQFIMAGASWDYPEYKPHVTLAYDDSFDPSTIPDGMTYAGGVWFEGEVREWLNTEFVPETA